MANKCKKMLNIIRYGENTKPQDITTHVSGWWKWCRHQMLVRGREKRSFTLCSWGLKLYSHCGKEFLKNIHMQPPHSPAHKGVSSLRDDSLCSDKSPQTNVCSSFIHNSPKMGTMQTSSVTGWGEHLVAGIYDRVTPSNKKGYLQPLGWISRELCWVKKANLKGYIW